MQTVPRFLAMLLCCVLSAAGFQANSKSAPKSPPIPAALKSAASDLDVYLRFLKGTTWTSKEIQAKGERYLSELQQAADAGVSGERFRFYQTAGDNFTLGVLSARGYESCLALVRVYNKNLEATGNPCEHEKKDTEDAFRHVQDDFAKARQ